MVKRYAVVRWTFFTSVSQKQAFLCFIIFGVMCVSTSFTTPLNSYIENLISLFDGYRISSFNIPELLRYVVLRLTPIYLIGFLVSSTIDHDSYFRIRLYRCSEWQKTLEYATLLMELLFVVLQLIASFSFFLYQSPQGQELSLYGDNLIVLLIPLTTILEMYVTILFFFNIYFISRNSVFSFLVVFFLYLLSAIVNIPFYPFGLSTVWKIRLLTPNLIISFMSAIMVFLLFIFILHLLLKRNVKKFLRG